MGKTLEKTAAHSMTNNGRGSRARDWRRGMSDNIAYALLIYTGLQIFVTIHALSEGNSSLLPYFALVVLVGMIIPACRWFEKSWQSLTDEEAADPSLAGAYRRDQFILWGLAIGLPLLLTGIFKFVATVL